jgi:hypothetical protein
MSLMYETECLFWGGENIFTFTMNIDTIYFAVDLERGFFCRDDSVFFKRIEIVTPKPRDE